MTRTSIARGTGLLLVAAAISLMASFVAPASAHTELTSSTPGEGAVVTALPEQLELTFSGDIAPAFAVVTAGTTQGPGQATQLEVAVDGPRVLATVPDTVRSSPQAGTWTISYRVTSADGHPIDGQVSFEVRTPPTTAPSSEAADPTSEATQPSASDSPASATQAPDTTAGTSDGDASSAPLSVIVIGALALVGAVGSLYLLGWRRRGRAEP